MTELEKFEHDKRCTLKEIEQLEKYYSEEMNYLKEDLRIAEEGIAIELAKLNQ